MIGPKESVPFDPQASSEKTVIRRYVTSQTMFVLFTTEAISTISKYQSKNALEMCAYISRNCAHRITSWPGKRKNLVYEAKIRVLEKCKACFEICVFVCLDVKRVAGSKQIRAVEYGGLRTEQHKCPEKELPAGFTATYHGLGNR